MFKALRVVPRTGQPFIQTSSRVAFQTLRLVVHEPPRLLTAFKGLSRTGQLRALKTSKDIWEVLGDLDSTETMGEKRKAEAGSGTAPKAAKTAVLVNRKRMRILKDGDIESGPVLYWYVARGLKHSLLKRVLQVVGRKAEIAIN